MVVVTVTVEATAPGPVTLTEAGLEQVGSGALPPVMVQVKFIVPVNPFSGIMKIVEMAAPPAGAVIEGGAGTVSMRM